MAIRFRGTLSDFSQLEYGRCPTEAVMLQEGETMEDVLKQALRQSVPLMILVTALTIVRFWKGLAWAREPSIGYMVLVACGWLALYAVLIVLHELIHAAFFPRRAVKDVWFYQMQAAMVYCNTPVTRTRFVIMSLAPAVLLGVLPFVSWLFWAQSVNFILSIAWGSMAWSMIFGGIGDFYNVRNVLAQVPKDAYVFNYGLHTYWIEDPRKK